MYDGGLDMLLLLRLYSYTSDKFLTFLKSEFFAGSFEPKLVFGYKKKALTVYWMQRLLRNK